VVVFVELEVVVVAFSGVEDLMDRNIIPHLRYFLADGTEQ